jgi:hypothetical protein
MGATEPGAAGPGEVASRAEATGRRGGGSPWAAALVAVLLVVPYLYYAWFAHAHLVPIEYADSVTYLWRRTFNVHYLTNRCLTQRVFFGLLGNDPGRIAGAQLLLFLATAVALFLLFSRRGAPILNVALGAFLAFVFSSYTFSVGAMAIAAEPVFLCLLLLFPCVLFLERGRWGWLAVLSTGVLFVFSRNVAPHTLLVLLAVRAVAVRPRPDRWRWLAYAVLTAVALGSIAVTARFDTSLRANLVSNIYHRVLPRPDVTERFHGAYGMPDGPYVEACRKMAAIHPCLGRPILYVNPESQAYDLLEDRQGFVRWIKEEGRRAYLLHLLRDDPGWTYETFRQQYRRRFEGNNIRHTLRYLGRKRPGVERNNRAVIVESGAGRDMGFLGFDSLALLRDALARVGLGRPHSLFLYIVFGLALCRVLPFTSHLALGTAMLAAGAVQFFLSYFGDAVEIARHVFPSLILLVVGGVVSFASLAEILVREVGDGWRRGRPGTT